MKDREIHVGLGCLAQDDRGLWRPGHVARVVRNSKPRRYVMEFPDGPSVEATADKLRSDEPAPPVPPARVVLSNLHGRAEVARTAVKLELELGVMPTEAGPYLRLALNALEAALIHLDMAYQAIPAPAPVAASPAPVVSSIVGQPKSKKRRRVSDQV